MLDRQGLLIGFILLSGCTTGPSTKPVNPEPLPVRQYVTVPPELTKRCTWPKAPPLKDVIEAARQRKTCLIQYEGQLDGIEKLKP